MVFVYSLPFLPRALYFQIKENSYSSTNAAHDIYLRHVELGLEKERILYTRGGIPMYDLNLLIHNPSEYTSNANLMRNPETIAKLVHDQVMEQHTYLSIPTHLADAARLQARVSQLETKNSALREELEKIKRKYEECKN